MREIVENYYSSTFVPNPTTGHIALIGQQEEEGVNYIKGRKKGKEEEKEKEEETTTKCSTHLPHLAPRTSVQCAGK